MNFLNIAFYKFVELGALIERKKMLKDLGLYLGLKGTVLLSSEGINGFLAGEEEEVRRFLAELREDACFANLDVKESYSASIPFARMLVKIKKEIIPMGRPDVRPNDLTGRRLRAREFKQWLDEKREVVVVDTRNDYEIKAGTFRGALDLNLKNFREFSDRLKDLPEELREKPVVMFCTGGIRCEKATALALQEGFKDVYQLEGGILRYFEEVGGHHYDGDCFVFDDRVAVDAELKPKGSGYRGGKARWKNQPESF